jgi:hypothetical protein
MAPSLIHRAQAEPLGTRSRCCSQHLQVQLARAEVAALDPDRIDEVFVQGAACSVIRSSRCREAQVVDRRTWRDRTT